MASEWCERVNDLWSRHRASAGEARLTIPPWLYFSAQMSRDNFCWEFLKHPRSLFEQSQNISWSGSRNNLCPGHGHHDPVLQRVVPFHSLRATCEVLYELCLSNFPFNLLYNFSRSRINMAAEASNVPSSASFGAYYFSKRSNRTTSKRASFCQ